MPQALLPSAEMPGQGQQRAVRMMPRPGGADMTRITPAA